MPDASVNDFETDRVKSRIIWASRYFESGTPSEVFPTQDEVPADSDRPDGGFVPRPIRPSAAAFIRLRRSSNLQRRTRVQLFSWGSVSVEKPLGSDPFELQGGTMKTGWRGDQFARLAAFAVSALACVALSGGAANGRESVC